MYIVVAKDVGILMLPLLLLNLESAMVNLVLPRNIRQPHKHPPFRSRFGQHMSTHACLSRLQIPHMDIVDVDDSFDLLAFAAQLG